MSAYAEVFNVGTNDPNRLKCLKDRDVTAAAAKKEKKRLENQLAYLKHKADPKMKAEFKRNNERNNERNNALRKSSGQKKVDQFHGISNCTFIDRVVCGDCPTQGCTNPQRSQRKEGSPEAEQNTAHRDETTPSAAAGFRIDRVISIVQTVRHDVSLIVYMIGRWYKFGVSRINCVQHAQAHSTS